MVDDEMLTKLRGLAERAERLPRQVSEAPWEEVVRIYAALREEAWAFAAENGLSGAPEFEAIAPTPDGLSTLVMLECQYRGDVAVEQDASQQRDNAVRQAALGLAGWAIGLTMGGELRL